LVADDGGDPARNQSLVKDMAENQKVLAFVGNQVPLTAAASTAYLESNRIPVVGGDVVSATWNKSPMLFPQVAAAATVIWGYPWVAAHLGKKRFGYLYCAEADGCKLSNEVWPKAAEENGLELAYRAQISLAQPDFTAECLSARNANVEALAIASDANTVNRVAASCTRQGFNPTYIIGSATLVNALAKNPQLAGAAGPQAAFPWMVDSTPATVEFQQALQRYAPGAEIGSASAYEWAAGKLFEKAGAALGETPTRDQLLAGLWRLKGENLGGLVPPLTFVENQPAPEARCFYYVRLDNGKWGAPEGLKTGCRP
jgi:branched-chain amino acid transport system substrate-binding protein